MQVCSAAEGKNQRSLVQALVRRGKPGCNYLQHMQINNYMLGSELKQRKEGWEVAAMHSQMAISLSAGRPRWGAHQAQ